MFAKPSVSVVVPAYNEEYFLADTLTALLQQDYGRTYEIIVVNNASTDRSPEIARAMGVRLLEEPCKGIVHAWSAGFATAQGEILAATDADTRVPADWLSRLVAALTARPDVVAAGRVYRFYDGPAWLRLGSRLLTFLTWHLVGVNMAMWRQAYEAISDLDTSVSIGADTRLTRELRRLGHVVLDRRLVVDTSARRFEAAFWPSVWLYLANDFWLALFRRPLYTEFRDIRHAPDPPAPR
jgi:glycosyltransferase involved in cell wall biosynthesis